MDYEKLKAAVWPIVALRIAAYVVFIAAVLGVTLPGRLDEYAALLLSFVFVLYLIVYGYGGYRAVAKFGFGPAYAAAIMAGVGVLSAAIVSWRGDWQTYAIGIVVEGIVGAVAGFAGASVAKMRKKQA